MNIRASAYHRPLNLAIYYYAVVGILPAQSNCQSTPEDIEAANDAGASGSSPGDVGISTTGIIILGTVAGIVVVIGSSSSQHPWSRQYNGHNILPQLANRLLLQIVISTVLFYIAKRQQWAIREKMRRSAKRVSQAVMTPLTPRFPQSQKPSDTIHLQSIRYSTRETPGRTIPKRGRLFDLEKGSITKLSRLSIVQEDLSDNTSMQQSNKRTWGSFMSFGRI